VALRSGGKIGWAIRKGSPRLAEAIMDFFQNYAEKQGVIEYRLARYHKAIKQIHDPTSTGERERFEQTMALFEKYGTQYAFDPLMLAAQGYQESQLNRSAEYVGAIASCSSCRHWRNRAGGVGVAESNIHASTKYLTA
jgi:membrane-bound lytic murein transglycosylase MltF